MGLTTISALQNCATIRHWTASRNATFAR